MEGTRPSLMLRLILSAGTALRGLVAMLLRGKRAIQQFETVFGLDSWRGTGVFSEVAESSVIMRGAPDIRQVHID